MSNFCIIQDTKKVKETKKKIRSRHIKQLKKDKFPKDQEELKNLALSQYKECHIMCNPLHEKHFEIIDKNIP